MIRKFEINDLESVMRIWLDTNIKAHDFIHKSYWHKNHDSVKKMLPDATVFVYEDHTRIQGFIGLMDNYIAGIFIDYESQSKGIGKTLLDYVKAGNSELFLQVFKKNVSAISFYLREDFVVLREQLDENTNEIELVMSWSRSRIINS